MLGLPQISHLCNAFAFAFAGWFQVTNVSEQFER
jgi:hypothetical protein